MMIRILFIQNTYAFGRLWTVRESGNGEILPRKFLETAIFDVHREAEWKEEATNEMRCESLRKRRQMAWPDEQPLSLDLEMGQN